MAQAVWTGSIAFGLVNVPVKLYIAVSPKDVRFHQFERGTNRRIRYERVAEPDFAARWAEPEAEAEVGLESGHEPEPDARLGPATGPAGEAAEPAPPTVRPLEAVPDQAEVSDRGRGGPSTEPAPVPYTEIVKGYEIAPGRFVTLTPEELEAIAPRRTGTIDIEEFVDLADIDPIYFEKTYHVAPTEPGAVKPYSLLLRAMTESGKVAIGRFVMRTKLYLAAIRPTRNTLALQTMYYSDEVRAAEELPFSGMTAQVSERELQIATQLIAVMATTWEPERYRDTYREQVLEMIEAKAGGEVVELPEAPAPPRVADLMDALRASVEAAKKDRQRASGSGRGA